MRAMNETAEELELIDDRDEGGFDDEEYCLEDDVLGPRDAKCERISREACDLMNNVNRSTVAMGMEAPFRPADEVSDNAMGREDRRRRAQEGRHRSKGRGSLNRRQSEMNSSLVISTMSRSRVKSITLMSQNDNRMRI